MRMSDRPAGYGQKKPTNVSINKELLQEAKEMGINLSATLETALTEAIRQRRREQWLAENAEAIADYNREVERRGVFSDGLRKF
jgi:antitoxin CcdA